MLIDGEPGLGKTTLAAELARFARAAGMRVGWGTCPGQEEAAPFQLWTQVLAAWAFRWWRWPPPGPGSSRT